MVISNVSSSMCWYMPGTFLAKYSGTIKDVNDTMQNGESLVSVSRNMRARHMSCSIIDPQAGTVKLLDNIFRAQYNSINTIYVLKCKMSKNNEGSVPLEVIPNTIDNRKSTSTTEPSKMTNRFPKKWFTTTRNVVPATPCFKGVASKLSGNICVSSAHQATKYDDTYRTLLSYLITKFDHRVNQAFKKNDEGVGLALLVKPVAPKKIVKVLSIDHSNSIKVIIDDVVQVDKDSKYFCEYHHELKKYIDNNN